MLTKKHVTGHRLLEIFWLEAIPGNLESEAPEATALTKHSVEATSLHKVLKEAFSNSRGRGFSPEAFRSRLDWRQL